MTINKIKNTLKIEKFEKIFMMFLIWAWIYEKKELSIKMYLKKYGKYNDWKIFDVFWYLKLAGN